MKQTTIFIDATVGAGKSTLMKLLEDKGYTAFPEPVYDNPLLDLFYHDREKYSFPLQIFFLNKRFEHIKNVKGHNKSVLDRSIYADKAFAQMLRDNGEMEESYYQIYEELLLNMLEHCTPPTLMINLEISVDAAIERIKKRGRDYEQIVERSYWEDLNARYRRFFEEYTYSPTLTIDVSHLDFENVPEDQAFVMQQINDKLMELGHDPLN